MHRDHVFVPNMDGFVPGDPPATANVGELR
jgi:hypothetical protein